MEPWPHETHWLFFFPIYHQQSLLCNYKKLISTCIMFQPTDGLVINKNIAVSAHALVLARWVHCVILKAGGYRDAWSITVCKIFFFFFYTCVCAVSVSEMTVRRNMPGAQEQKNNSTVSHVTKWELWARHRRLILIHETPWQPQPAPTWWRGLCAKIYVDMEIITIKTTSRFRGSHLIIRVTAFS